MHTSPYDFDVVTGPSTPPAEQPRPPEPEKGVEPPPHRVPGRELPQK